MILEFLWEEGVANGWEWPNTPSLTHPLLKLEHYNTFHSLIFNEIFQKNRGGQFWFHILYRGKSVKHLLDAVYVLPGSFSWFVHIVLLIVQLDNPDNLSKKPILYMHQNLETTPQDLIFSLRHCLKHQNICIQLGMEFPIIDKILQRYQSFHPKLSKKRHHEEM